MSSSYDPLDIELYRAELQKPRYTDEELAQGLGLDPAEVRRRREHLAELRLLRQVDEDTWVAVSPHAAADALLGDEEKELEQRRTELARRREELTALTAEYLEARSLRSSAAHVETLHGLETVRAALTELAALCTTSVDSMVPGGAQSDSAVRAALPLDRAQLARGVALRSLFLDSARSHPGTQRYLNELREAGAEVRTTGLLPTRLVLYDRRTAVVPLDAQDTARGAVVVHDPPLVALLVHLFDLYWGQAASDAAPRHEDQLSSTEQAILRMMAAGQLDEAISRQVGMSVRTTRRIISGLTRRLGANSRFQAGVRAVAHGWIAPRPASQETTSSPRA
ncbi:regulatory protein, luxR family [Streptomyces sp. BpilaLS-43]|uniref:helix-turn-helix transcriptional regulator n=1 Tax=Streptomyces sp. BpilaLS-43 TaxID=1839778 RepID=UPI00081B7E1A|nr:helix-turn-helix transcriptional regulator [Streptomyces sp. BpilaLS-43]SCD39799.1 regulatory protein, luxR family [Streptomyces sp. BpilaLS-43]